MILAYYKVDNQYLSPFKQSVIINHLFMRVVRETASWKRTEVIN